MILAVIAATLLSAAAEPDGKALFQEGQKLYKSAKYADAVAKFEAAYQARPHPVIFFNIGKCYEQLGDNAKALRAYRDYLRLLPEATDKDTVKDSVASLERKLKEKGLQQVLIFLEPSTARLEVDGKPLAGSPASTELTVGPHKLTASADGFQSVERSFTMAAGKSAELTVNLEPKAAETPPITKTTKPADTKPADTKPADTKPADPKTTAKPSDAPKTEPTKTATLTPADTKPAPGVDVKATKPEPKPRVFTWVAAGVAGAGAVAGGVMLGLSGGAAAELAKNDPNRTREQADTLKGTRDGMGTGAGIAFGVAGAAAVAAVVLFLVEGK